MDISQGSILGPFLFLMHINDLSHHDNDVFAKNTSLLYSVVKIQEIYDNINNRNSIKYMFHGGFLINKELRSTSTIKYLTEPTNDITIRLMVHLDEVLTRKLVKQHKITTRKKLKMLTNRVLDDAKKYFKHPSLNQTVNFKLLDTRFVRNGRAFAIDANAAKYLKNYCDWQTKKKTTQNKLYYSVLLTGMDLFHIHNGKQIRTNSGRSYTRGACSVHKSCALVEWDPKIIGFLFAHEIGHSLGMGHDGTSIYCKEQTNIMAMRYDPWHHPKSWSTCSLNSLKQFMRSRQSWCVRNDRNPSITFKYSRL